MTLNHFLAALLTTASITVAGPSLAQAIKSTDGLMTDAQGKTLYLFTKDTANKSNCSGGCLAAWPAFIPKPEAQPNGDLGIITREDGTRQWTHKSRPLYYYIGDTKAGDKTGDKQGGVWFVLPMTADGKVSSLEGNKPVAVKLNTGYTY